jgi:ribosomal protein S18 acetylase RimI-like enzyme
MNKLAANTLHIAALAASDAQAYRDLMLEAYEQAADAFTTTAEERRAEPMAWWLHRIAAPNGLTQSFGAWQTQTQTQAQAQAQAQALVGTVALEYAAKPKTRHSALVIGMYVTASARRCGAGRLLVQAALAAAAARPGVLLLRLAVTEGNAPAIGLYESMGFTTWGTEPLAVRTPEGLKGKAHMFMALPRAGAAASTVGSDGGANT